jgi:cytochrome c oxidase subunit 5a
MLSKIHFLPLLRRIPSHYNHLACRFYSSSEEDVSGGPAFQQKWISFFHNAPDGFELRRGLNNVFGYDCVPPAPIIEAALKACRRLDDFSTAVRIFGGLKGKTENDRQYEQYLAYLRPLMDELGVMTPEELGRHDSVL